MNVIKNYSIKRIITLLKKSTFFNFLLQRVAYYCVRLLFCTYRLRVHYDGDPVDVTTMRGVFYAWHQQIIPAVFYFFKIGAPAACMASPSDDGKIAGYVCQRLGFTVVYGSAYQSPVAVTRHALKELESTGRFALIGDGSRGPAGQLKPGVHFLANKAQVPVVFLECTQQWPLTIQKSWDRFQIPLPFSTITITVRVLS